MNEVTVKKGRPSKYSKSIVKDVLEKLSQGIGIKHAAMQCGITWTTWRTWMDKDKTNALRDAYIKSKEYGIEFLISEMDERMEKALDKKNISMSECKLIETYTKLQMWKASKLSPKYYGTEKQTLSITDADDKKIEISWASD